MKQAALSLKTENNGGDEPNLHSGDRARWAIRDQLRLRSPAKGIALVRPTLAR